MREVGDDDVGAAAGAFDLFCHGVEFGLGARCDDDVGTGFGEGHRDRRAEAAACPGHHRHLIVEPEPVEYHVFPLPVVGRHRNKVGRSRVTGFWNRF